MERGIGGVAHTPSVPQPPPKSSPLPGVLLRQGPRVAGTLGAMETTSGTADANGLTLAYEMRGSGPPLLAVMGLSGQLTDWPVGLIDMLAEQFTVITFDNRDSGLSTELAFTPPPRSAYVKAGLTRKAPSTGYLLSDMAADAVGLLDALGLDRVHLMGMSMGGMISQAVAIEYPTRVMSVTSVMSHTGDGKNGTPDPRIMLKLLRSTTPSREEAAQVLTERYRMFAGSSWDFEEHLIRAKAGVERSWRPEGTDRQLAAIQSSPDRTPDLRKLRVPTLVIHGLEDTLVRPTGGIATAEAIVGSRLLMFPDMGHDLPANRWGEIVEAIISNTRRAHA